MTVMQIVKKGFIQIVLISFRTRLIFIIDVSVSDHLIIC